MPGRSIPPTPTTKQILGSIEHRIRDLRCEIDALAGARAELVGGRSETRKRPGRAARRATRSGGSGNAGAPQAEGTFSLSDDELAKTLTTPGRRSGSAGRRATRRAGGSAELVPGKRELLLSQSGGLTTAELGEPETHTTLLSNRYALQVSCAECKAKAGEPCRAGTRVLDQPHQVRREFVLDPVEYVKPKPLKPRDRGLTLPKPPRKKRRSLPRYREILGGGFETNRRRH